MIDILLYIYISELLRFLYPYKSDLLYASFVYEILFSFLFFDERLQFHFKPIHNHFTYLND